MTLAVPAKVNSSGTGYTSVTGSAKASYGYNSSGQLSSILTGLSGYSFSYDIFGKKNRAYAERLNDDYFTPVHKAVADRTNYVNTMRQ